MPKNERKSSIKPGRAPATGQYCLRSASGRLAEPPKSASRTDWAAVDAKSDAELTAAAQADADNPPLDDAFLQAARRVSLEELVRARKEQVTLRLERGTLEWFRSQGKGYQTRISAVLDLYVKSQQGGRGA